MNDEHPWREYWFLLGLMAAGALAGALIGILATAHMQASAAEIWSALSTFAGLMTGGAVYLVWLWRRLKP